MHWNFLLKCFPGLVKGSHIYFRYSFIVLRIFSRVSDYYFCLTNILHLCLVPDFLGGDRGGVGVDPRDPGLVSHDSSAVGLACQFAPLGQDLGLQAGQGPLLANHDHKNEHSLKIMDIIE